MKRLFLLRPFVFFELRNDLIHVGIVIRRQSSSDPVTFSFTTKNKKINKIKGKQKRKEKKKKTNKRKMPE